MSRSPQHYRCLVFWGSLLLLLSPEVVAQTEGKPERTKPPKWDIFPAHIFFKDAFAEGLVGSRPSSLGQPIARKATTNGSTSPPSKPAEQEFKWSSLVSAQSLEDEIKALQIQIQTTVTTPSKFRGGGYQDARRIFTELATLFAVIHEYDGDVRWKQHAATARELFTRAAANTEPTSIQAFNEATRRKEDLEELVRGGTLGQDNASLENSWSRINRAALMQCFTQCYDEGLAIWAANDSDFKINAANIRREAELLMMFSVVLTQGGMEDGDDQDYSDYSMQLKQAVRKVLDALNAGDTEACRQAISTVGQSCTACHDDYRG